MPENWGTRTGTLNNVRSQPRRISFDMAFGVITWHDDAGREIKTPFYCHNTPTTAAILAAGNGAVITLRGEIIERSNPRFEVLSSFFKPGTEEVLNAVLFKPAAAAA